MDTTQSSAILYGLMGAGSALILSTIGAAYGSAKANVTLSPSSANKVQQKSSEWESPLLDVDGGTTVDDQQNKKSPLSTIVQFIPIIIAGVLAIYGLIYSVIVLASVTAPDYSASRGYAQFVGGLTLGFCCLASGIAVGIVGKRGLISISENKTSVVKVVLNLIYCEALGLYGLIFGLIAASSF